MEFIIGCVVYIAVCEGICKLLGLDDFINPTWNTNEKSYLSSRILTIKQIKEDF